MKKILLASVAGAGLLASCGGVTVTLPDYFSGRSSNLTLTNLSNYSTDWQLTRAVNDQSGNTLAAGTYVICDNKATQISADVAWTGTLSKLGLQLKGVRTGEVENLNLYPYSGVTGSGSTTATFSVGAGVAPQSLNPQAIVVNPVTNVTVKGYTYLRVQGADAIGLGSNILESNNSIPVVDCL